MGTKATSGGCSTLSSKNEATCWYGGWKKILHHLSRSGCRMMAGVKWSVPQIPNMEWFATKNHNWPIINFRMFAQKISQHIQPKYTNNI
jgi:hypothetical protein